MVGNHFTPFFPQHVAEIIRKGQPMLKKVAKALEGLKQLSEFVPKKSLLKSGLQSMIEHLEAADSVGRTCNFKFGSAETEITEDVPLPRDDTIVTGHSRNILFLLKKAVSLHPKKLRRIQQNRRIINDSYNHHHHHHHGNCTIKNEYQIANRSRLNFDG